MNRTFIALSVFFLLTASLHASTPAENLAKKPDSWFHTDESRKAMECILSWQSERGDWPKNTNTTVKEPSGDRSKLQGTFDNGATTGEFWPVASEQPATHVMRRHFWPVSTTS